MDSKESCNHVTVWLTGAVMGRVRSNLTRFSFGVAERLARAFVIQAET